MLVPGIVEGLLPDLTQGLTPQLNLAPEAIALRVGLSAWLIAIAVWDVRTARIPNWLTFPVMLAAGAWRLYHHVWLILPIWVLIYMIWKVNIVGGGDAKLLMGLFALFPTYEFAFLFAVVVLVVSLPLLYRKHWWRRPAQMAQGVAQRISSGQIFPTHEELQTEGQQYAWTFCLPGLIYLWWLW
ncbi:MAG: prepilin peptidase [Chloroflexi bacterium]|nr:MAG: prepilin peptidase [Chloroflexota bacterium]